MLIDGQLVPQHRELRAVSESVARENGSAGLATATELSAVWSPDISAGENDSRPAIAAVEPVAS